SVELTNAHGLLKAEMRRLGSIVLDAADQARVPGGAALAVDRVAFSQAVHDRITRHPGITVVRSEVTDLPSPGVVATGPLTSQGLSDAIARRLETGALAFFDAIAPIVSADSLDTSRMFRASRYGKGGGDDYWNAPFTAEQYDAFVTALRTGEQYQPHHDFDRTPYFEGCLPVEEMAARGRDVLRFGSIHRNAYINSPRALTAHLSAKDDPKLLFAGQLTGVEGYTESAATGILAGINLARILAGEAPVVPPPTTMLGALYRYVH